MAEGSDGAILGNPYRILYESKNLQSGVPNIIATVMRPDLTLAAVLALREIPNEAYRGVYYADLITKPEELEGEWIARVASPTENRVVSLRITFKRRYDLEMVALLHSVAEHVNRIPREEVVGEVEVSGELVGYIEDVSC